MRLWLIPLDDPRAKIGRAKQHLAELEEQRGLWLKSRPYALFPYPTEEKTVWKFGLHRFDDPVQIERDRFGLIIGDYVHNLRSALDHLVWQLVTVANGKKPKREGDVAFPIVKTHPTDFWNRPVIQREELTFEQALFLEGFQPYRVINPTRPHPLEELHALWNADKHRLVTEIRVTLHKNGPVFKYTDCRVVESEWDSTAALRGDAEIAQVRVEVIGPNPDVSVAELPVDVAVGEGGRLIQDVQNMTFIVEQIVDNSAQFFP